MFDEQKEAPSGTTQAKPEDIFDAVDSAPIMPISSIPQPQFINNSVPAAPASSQPLGNVEPVLVSDGGNKMTKILKVVGIVVGVLLVLSVGTWYALSALGTKTKSATKQLLDDSSITTEKAAEQEMRLIEQQLQAQNQVVTPEVAPVVTSPVADSVLPAAPVVSTSTTTGADQVKKDELPVVDSDKDGLPDSEEGRLGTNPLKTDSDGDTLSDFDEVNVYGTDPLKVDTDGDSFSDGSEVSKGYNPRGSGKLMLDTNTSKYKNN